MKRQWTIARFRFELAPAHDLMLNHSVADWAFEFPVWHLSEGDGSESWKGGRVIAQPCRIFNFLHVGGRTGSNNFTRTGTLLARGRGGLGEQQSRCLRQTSQCFTDSRMCRGAHRHLWWTTMKESKPGRNRHSVHRDLITGSHCTCPLCQMKAPRRVWTVINSSSVFQSFVHTIWKKNKSKDWEHSYIWYRSDAHHAPHIVILHHVLGLNLLKASAKSERIVAHTSSRWFMQGPQLSRQRKRWLCCLL